MVARFDGRNPRAEAWVKDQSSRLITEIVDDTRADIRGVLTSGLERGDNPKTTALDVVGRINRATGKREGGLIGLTSQQMGWTQNAMDELRSGDPAQMARYLERKARDKRFDPTVRRAIREGKPVSAADSRKMVSRYSDRLLKYRGDVISRTETLASLHEAQDEGIRQLVDSGKLQKSQIKRAWDSSGDARVRNSHAMMDEQKRGLDEAFMSPNGYMLKFPGDTSLGAPGSEVIQCRCVVRLDIDFFAGLT